LNRSDALARLLQQTGFAGAERTPLPGDASTRRYERLAAADGRRAMLMDAPPSAESQPCPPGATPAERRDLGWNATSRLAASRVEAFVAVAAYLENLGLAPPAIYGADCEAGYAVIEDLGDALYAQVIPQGADEIALYEEAARVLAHVHRMAPPARLEGAAGASWPLLDYDALALEVNADLFVDWLPRAAEVRIDDAARARWEKVRDALIVKALGFPRAFTIRDYHAENLLWLPQRRGLKRVGLLDFQDAVRGWRGWDFSMLLHDARRDVSPAAHAAALRAYLDETGVSGAELERELAVLGALNTMRILGIFSRLAGRDGKTRYLGYMPRMWGHLARTLEHSALEDARAFVASVAAPYLEKAA
jgi:aminoglycoside/choline kinase family phosphotransferase